LAWRPVRVPRLCRAFGEPVPVELPVARMVSCVAIDTCCPASPVPLLTLTLVPQTERPRLAPQGESEAAVGF
jgi:hypothetical protein